MLTLCCPYGTHGLIIRLGSKMTFMKVKAAIKVLASALEEQNTV
jgi:hypothetical protein